MTASADDTARNDQASPAWLRHLAHDLRSPLSPLQTGVSLLRGGRLGASQQTELLDAMQRQLHVLIQVIDDTGDLIARRNPALTEMDVGSLLDMVSVRLRARFEEAGLQFEVRAPGLPMSLACDGRDMLRLLGYLALRVGEVHGSGTRVIASVQQAQGRIDLQLDAASDADTAKELTALVDRVAQPDPAGVTDAMLHRILHRHDAELRAAASGTGLVLSLPAPPEAV